MFKRMCSLLSGLLIAFSIASCGQPQKANYVSKYFFENSSGTFDHDSQYDVFGQGDIGKMVSIEIKSFSGFTFDANNTNNVTSLSLSAGENILSAYYKKIDTANYVIKYYFEVSEGNFQHNPEYDVAGSGKIGSVVNAEKKSFSGYLFDENNPNNVLSLTLSAGDNYLAVYYKKESQEIGEVKYIDCDEFALDTSFYLPSSSKGGIKFLSNHSDINPKLDGNDSYYDVLIANNTIAFNLVDNSGIHLIKNVAFSGNNVVLSIIKNDSGYVVKNNGQTIFNVTNIDILNLGLKPIESWGSAYAYVEDALKPLTVSSGELSFDEIKQNVISDIFSTVKYKNNFFNSVSLSFNYDIIDLDLSTVGGCAYDYSLLRNSLDSATDIESLFNACAGSFELRLRAYREYANYCLNDSLYKIHYSFFMPRCETSETLSEGAAPVLFSDFNKSDLRYYVPNAYKLRTWDPTNPGLLDKYSEELASCNSIESLYPLSDKYTTDCIRALAFHDAEYYYWQEYNLHGQDTYNVWWFLYTYYGAGGTGFKYYGNAFGPSYTWNQDFRLSAFFYNQDMEGGATTNEMIIGGLSTMISLQTVANRPYSITLNTCGGSLDRTEIVSDSSQTVDLSTYVPIKEGFDFAGWYPSRTFKGDPVTLIGQGNTNSLTLYACWKINDEVVLPSVMPASFIGENQIFQRDKPIVISGTGTDGIVVTVDFDGQQKTATIENSKWSVSFPAKAGSFDPKTLTISGDNNLYVFHNILIGDVWLCGGQSNMEYQVSWLYGWGAEKVGEFGDLGNFDKIRVFRQYVSGDTASEESPDNMQCDRWYIGNSVVDFIACSALGVVFANKLAETLDCPIGIINSNRGGTVIEEWLSAESIAICGSSLPDNPLKNPESRDSRFYETMTSKFIGGGLSIKGVLWYQGESNSNDTDIYEEQFNQLVRQYREIFNDDNLPIICQQLVQYSWIDFVNMRKVQWSCMEDMNNVYCACSIDTGNVRGGPDEIHAPEKITVGTRMANIALEKIYGIGSKSIAYYPISAIQQDNLVTVTFEEGNNLTGNALNFFQIEDFNGSLHDVSGQISGNTITFNVDFVATRVLYAQLTYLGSVSLYGDNALPVAPFVIAID